MGHESHESKVRGFFTSAVHCYESIMGQTWLSNNEELSQRGGKARGRGGPR
jgi:hypothetical protein